MLDMKKTIFCFFSSCYCDSARWWEKGGGRMKIVVIFVAVSRGNVRCIILVLGWDHEYEHKHKHQ